MNPALWISKTGLDAQQTRMSVVANNLANVGTTAFKRDRANFEDLFYQTTRAAGGMSSQNTEIPTGLNRGTGVRVVSTDKLHTQGNMSQTEAALDMAINGRGFFSVVTPTGETAYTRDGSFKLDSSGALVTSSGYPLQPGITIPPNAQQVVIGNDGNVTVKMDGSTEMVSVGQVAVTDFANPMGLQPVGENLYKETGSSGAATVGTGGQAGMGQVRQGFLETSNVNIVEEMVAMIETQRAYEMNSKAISTTDEMLQYLNNNL